MITTDRVYNYLKNYYSARGEYPSVKAIAAGLRVKQETVTREIRNLADAGKLTHKKGQVQAMQRQSENWLTKPILAKTKGFA